MAVLVIDLAPVYLNLYTFFDLNNINTSGQSIKFLALASFITRAKSVFGKPI